MALVALLVAVFASAAFADTGDIIEGPANGTPAAATNGWQAGICTSNVPACDSTTTGQYATQAASHPAVGFTQFIVKNEEVLLGKKPVGILKDIRVDLPVGLSVNPSATPQCEVPTFEAGACSTESVVGESGLSLSLLGVVTPPTPGVTEVPVYNLVPEAGHPALFGFTVAGQHVYLKADIEWNGNYHEGFTIAVPESPLGELIENRLTFNGQAGNGSFLTSPSTCSSDRSIYSTLMRADSVGSAGGGPNANFPNGSSYFSSPLPSGVGPTGCAGVPFAPKVSFNANGAATDSPSGPTIALETPFNTAAGAINTSNVKDASVALPRGNGLNPAAATKVAFCGDNQFPTHSTAAISCPAKSVIGTAAIEAPELPKGSLVGNVYLGSQLSRDPTSGNEYRVFVDAASARYGVDVRLIGNVVANPTTGQLTAIFRENPQVPFESVKLNLSQSLGAISSAPVCSSSAASQISPWSGGALAQPVGTLTLTKAPGGGACAKTMAERPFAPGFSAKPVSSKALTYTPYQLTISRPEGQQELKGFNITLPPGATAKLAGVPYCTAKEYGAAANITGAAEQKSSSCSKNSLIGVATIQSGTGATPLSLEGKAYLSGPYKGAPLSIVVITPAVAGPFDLGNVTVHAPLALDPETGVVSTSAEIPDVFGGVKLDIRSIAVNLNRKEFTLNGTNCAKSAVTGTVQGGGGDPTNPAAWSSAPVSAGFEAQGCSELKFSPKLKVQLSGQTRRAKHPRLKAVLTTKEGQANVALASVALPHTIFLDQSSLGTVCTRPQFAAEECPKKSVYGHAVAYSPLLAKPLEGQVVLRSSNNTLPDMVADLKGQVSIVLDGKIDSFKGGIRTTFASIPDLPVSRFVVTLPGGKHGLLQNSTNLCAKTVKGIIRLKGQNGKKVHSRPKVQTSCKKKHGKKGKKSKAGKGHKGGKKTAKGGHKSKAKQ